MGLDDVSVHPGFGACVFCLELVVGILGPSFFFGFSSAAFACLLWDEWSIAWVVALGVMLLVVIAVCVSPCRGKSSKATSLTAVGAVVVLVHLIPPALAWFSMADLHISFPWLVSFSVSVYLCIYLIFKTLSYEDMNADILGGLVKAKEPSAR